MDELEYYKQQSQKAQDEAREYAGAQLGLASGAQFAPSREHAKTIALKRAEGLSKESALYFWLVSALDSNPPSKEIEEELYNLMTRGYVNRF